VPTYQYACTECGDRLEVVQRFSDDPLTVCTACGGKLRKVFSPVGIVFKGSGFYRTDSRSGSASTAGTAAANGSKDKAESTAKPDSAASSANGSDSAKSATESKPKAADSKVA
jgi:putative FmdB family regulatory protein